MAASPGVPPDVAYPVRFGVDYPDRDLNRLTTAFRIFTVIPIAIVLGSISGYSTQWSDGGEATTTVVVGGTGLLVIPPLLMILFRDRLIEVGKDALIVLEVGVDHRDDRRGRCQGAFHYGR